MNLFLTFYIILLMFSLIFSSHNNIWVFPCCKPVSIYTKHWSIFSLLWSLIIESSHYPSSHCHLSGLRTKVKTPSAFQKYAKNLYNWLKHYSIYLPQKAYPLNQRAWLVTNLLRTYLKISLRSLKARGQWR